MKRENVSAKITIRIKEKTLKHLKERAVKERREYSEMARILIENEVDQ